MADSYQMAQRLVAKRDRRGTSLIDLGDYGSTRGQSIVHFGAKTYVSGVLYDAPDFAAGSTFLFAYASNG